MNKKQWTGLLMIYISYLLLGATMFFFLEQENLENRAQKFTNYRILFEQVEKTFKQEYKEYLKDYCGKPFDTKLEMDEIVPEIWDFYNAFFFVVTVVSTIGYGNLHPTTDQGRLLMVFYAIIGIPLNGILLSSLGQFFGAVVDAFMLTVLMPDKPAIKFQETGHRAPSWLATYHHDIRSLDLERVISIRTQHWNNALQVEATDITVFRKAHRKYKNHGNQYGKRCRLALNVATYLAPGLIIFIFLPAGVFSYFEDWSYIEGVYFAFVTLTTIGFGDLVAGQRKEVAGINNEFLSVYKIMLIFWVIFGLGYLIMLLGFVAQAMQNKKIIQLEEKLMDSLTHSKIWHGFAKDMGYVRRLMNEVLFEKVKPIFKDDKEVGVPLIVHRSKSLPDLKAEEVLRLPHRERAMSVHVAKTGLVRMFSETDLQRIDRNATFAAASTIPVTFDLMRRVIDACAGVQEREWPSSEDSQGGFQGVDGFADEDVLASELWHDRYHNTAPATRHPSSLFDVPSYENTISRQPHRGRAMSECPSTERLAPAPESNPAEAGEWTWSGPNANKLHDIIKQRSKQRLLMGLNKGRHGSISSGAGARAKKLNPLTRRRRCVTENNSRESNMNGEVSKNTLSVPEHLERKRQSLPGETMAREAGRDHHYMTTTAVPQTSRTEFPQHLHDLYSRGDTLFSGNRRDILQDTSLADFLRVITTLHSSVGERLVSAEQSSKPRRKMGTASLTPPRIRSLFELFPEPTAPSTPKLTKKRKTSKIKNLFRTDSKRDTTDTDSITAFNEKTPEPSNLKRLGRFLLRSYSTTPKDAEEIPKSFLRKRFSMWPSDERGDMPPFQIQVDSPSEVSKASTDVTITIEPDPSSSTPIFSRNVHTQGLLYPPTDTPPAARRRANSSAASSRKPSFH